MGRNRRFVEILRPAVTKDYPLNDSNKASSPSGQVFEAVSLELLFPEPLLLPLFLLPRPLPLAKVNGKMKHINKRMANASLFMFACIVILFLHDVDRRRYVQNLESDGGWDFFL